MFLSVNKILLFGSWLQRHLRSNWKYFDSVSLSSSLPSSVPSSKINVMLNYVGIICCFYFLSIYSLFRPLSNWLRLNEKLLDSFIGKANVNVGFTCRLVVLKAWTPRSAASASPGNLLEV